MRRDLLLLGKMIEAARQAASLTKDTDLATLETLERGGFVIDDLAHGELPKSPSFVRPMIVGSATRPIDALTCRS